LQAISQQHTKINSLTILEAKVTPLCSKLIPENDEESSDDDDDDDTAPSPEGDLLIGDSLIRDVLPTDNRLTVDSTRGATLNVIKKKLKSINPRKKRYQRVIIVAVTNDTSSRRPPEKIASECEATVSIAKQIAAEVVVSSIPPEPTAEQTGKRSMLSTNIS